FGFVPKTVNKLRDVFYPHARALRGCDFQMDKVDPRFQRNTQLVGSDELDRLLTSFDDTRKRGVTRFVEPQVGRDDGWYLYAHGFNACVGFAVDAGGSRRWRIF